jgi:hypothetical protein
MASGTYRYKGGNSNSILQTAWEHQCKNAGTPLGKYYKTWRKLRDRELQYQIAAKRAKTGWLGIGINQNNVSW